MSAHDHTHDTSPTPAQGQRPGTPLSKPVKTALLMIALVGGFYLLREHWSHVAGNWIYLLLLACPLLHLFHGHGGHGGHVDTRRTGTDPNKE
ncbi:MAG: DUF2933 domain-containing protein [Rubrivivax sp.]|nr:DUF2933 domain-containing protein [Rubrivivax sp.]